MKATIREATIDHLPGIFHLGERIFTSDYPNLYRTWDEYEVLTLFQYSSEHCHVAEVEGALAGFALGTEIEKRNSAWSYGHLLWLGVDPAYQRQGIASRLVQTFRETMRESGVRMLLMDTQEDNEQAVAFFERMGFSSPVRHLYMTLNLSSEARDTGE